MASSPCWLTASGGSDLLRGPLALCLLLTGTPALADTAEAALTLPARTLFLSADNSASALPMVRREGPRLHLTFAQLHLGFPLPPTLSLTLEDTAEGWRVIALTLDAPEHTLAAGTALTVSAQPSDAGLTLLISGEVLTHAPLGPTLIPVTLQIILP